MDHYKKKWNIFYLNKFSLLKQVWASNKIEQGAAHKVKIKSQLSRQWNQENPEDIFKWEDW